MSNEWLGLLTPTALRLTGWMFLLLPIGGLFTGYFRTHPDLAVVQTIGYFGMFLAARRLAAAREQAD